MKSTRSENVNISLVFMSLEGVLSGLAQLLEAAGNPFLMTLKPS